MTVGTPKAASLLGLCCQRVRQLLAQGRIQGAKKVGRFWQIPLFNGMPKVIPGRRGPQGRWRKFAQRVATFIHVNSHILRSNKKNHETVPAISVHRGGRVERCHEVEIKGPSKLIYQPECPKCSGATLWIEVEATIEIITKTFQQPQTA